MLDINSMLEFVLTHTPQKDPSSPIHVKIAFDRGTMTSGKRIQQEVGTFQVLNELSLQEAKSHTTAHEFIIYLGLKNILKWQRNLQNHNKTYKPGLILARSITPPPSIPLSYHLQHLHHSPPPATIRTVHTICTVHTISTIHTICTLFTHHSCTTQFPFLKY